MQRVSTNLTLFYKFFIPIFWIVLVGSVTAAVFLSPIPAYGNIPGFQFRIGLLAVFLSGLAMLALTLMRLKRVEMDDLYVYVTNYFKNYRYPYHNIQNLHETRFFLLNVVTITLKKPGSFGKKMTFVASNRLYRDFFEERPELYEKLKIENGKLRMENAVKLDRAFTPSPGRRIYAKEEILALRLRASFIAQMAARLDLAFLEGHAPQGNLCLANSEEVRPEYRSVFGEADVICYCAALLPDREMDIEVDELPLPENAGAFWSFVEAGL